MEKNWRQILANVLELPELLQIPSKLLPIIEDINNYRYFLLEGGRGGGKSQAIGRFILYLCEQKTYRVVCGREIQLTIVESVYSLLTDLIRKHNLYWEIQSHKLIHKTTKSVINFRGFREQGSFNIQGMEGIDIVWIDEAQAITKDTLDVLIPTIRKEKAKIFFSMNRFLYNDPVYSTFSGRKDCNHIHINYDENIYCTQALVNEANECKERSEVDYAHIWKGEPLAAGDDHLLDFKTVHESPNLIFYDEGTQRKILAVDVARFGEDETVFTIIQSQNIRQWKQIYQHTWKGKPLTEVAGKTLDLKRDFRVDLIAIDDVGLGGGVTDILSEQRRVPEPFIGNAKSSNDRYKNMDSEGFFRMKGFFDKGDIKIMKDPILTEQLLSLRFKYNSNNIKTMITKDEMRKLNVKSPDRAKALMMALYYTDRIFSAKINLNLPREAIN